MAGEAENVHATAIALGGAAALLRGPPASGKSDLALRCLALHAGPTWTEPPQLLADDQVLLAEKNGRLIARCPETISGKIEVRGIGIIALPFVQSATVRLVVDLSQPDRIERLPDTGQTVQIRGVDVPHMQIAPFEQSAAIKVLLALSAHRNA